MERLELPLFSLKKSAMIDKKALNIKNLLLFGGGAKITTKIYELVLSKSYNLYKENTLTLFDEREIYNSGKEYIEAT